MKIEAVDFFYLSMPVVKDIGDGSQDALLVRLQAGGCVGWGECEASPLVSIASWACPMSHSACKPVSASVLGQRLEGIADIRRINNLVRENSFDLLQTDHTLSGIDIAMWDLLSRKWELPVYRLLGYKKALPKTPYASQLFGDDPAETYQRAKEVRDAGYVAAKFGWGPFGRGSVEDDDEQIQAAREGLGKEAELLVDVGTVWGDDVSIARSRLPAMKRCRVGWLEEPFVSVLWIRTVLWPTKPTVFRSPVAKAVAISTKQRPWSTMPSWVTCKSIPDVSEALRPPNSWPTIRRRGTCGL